MPNTSYIYFLVTCCSSILLSSTTQTTIDGYYFLGKYITYATTPEFNGKKVYVKETDARYCLRTPEVGGKWVLGVCSNLTQTTGYEESLYKNKQLNNKSLKKKNIKNMKNKV